MISNKYPFVNSRCLTALTFSLLLNAMTTACFGSVEPLAQEPSSHTASVPLEPEVTLVENEPDSVSEVSVSEDSISEVSLSEDSLSEENAIASDDESPQSVVEPTRLITETSIGSAQTCMTPTDLQQALPTMTVGEWGDGPLVDTEGVAVTNADGELMFYGLAAGWRVGENRPLTLFYTRHPAYRTAAGIGPGATIEMAERVYGPASLSYHTQAESREFVRFENGPENITFRTGTGDEAGIYLSDSGEYNQTNEYREGATIRSVWVSDRNCPDDF